MKKLLGENIKSLFAFNSTERVWELPFFMALGVGLVLGVGAFYERLDLGLIAMIGVMAFLYSLCVIYFFKNSLPTPIPKRETGVLASLWLIL